MKNGKMDLEKQMKNNQDIPITFFRETLIKNNSICHNHIAGYMLELPGK